MPSLTICPNYFYAKTPTNRLYPGMLELLGNIPVLTQTCSRDNNTDQTFFGNQNINDVMTNTALPLDQFLIGCEWKGNLFNCSTHFEIVLTPTGYCYAFHHRFLDPTTDNFETFQSSIKLSVMIDIRQSEAVFGMTSKGAGVSLFVHKRKSDIPDISQNAIALGPGFEHNIALEKYVTKRLLPPYSTVECESDPSYTQSACMSLCKQEDMYGQCSCWDDVLRNSNCPFCAQTTCANFQFTRYYNGKCGCQPECEEIGYKFQASSFTYPADLYEEQALQFVSHYQNISDVRKNVMSVNIYFDRMVTQVSTEKAAISGWQVISDLGGSLGLCLGASLLTVVEFMEFFFLMFVACVKKCKAGKSANDKVTPLD